jgi:hypothetical protein
MEDIFNDGVELARVFGLSVFWLLALITFPVWGIPYLIYKKVKNA